MQRVVEFWVEFWVECGALGTKGEMPCMQQCLATCWPLRAPRDGGKAGDVLIAVCRWCMSSTPAPPTPPPVRCARWRTSCTLLRVPLALSMRSGCVPLWLLSAI